MKVLVIINFGYANVYECNTDQDYKDIFEMIVGMTSEGDDDLFQQIADLRGLLHNYDGMPNKQERIIRNLKEIVWVHEDAFENFDFVNVEKASKV